ADRFTAAGVLPARPEFFPRLEQLKAGTFDKALVTRLYLHELGRDEIESFIRGQLPPGEDVNAFTTERSAALPIWAAIRRKSIGWARGLVARVIVLIGKICKKF